MRSSEGQCVRGHFFAQNTRRRRWVRGNGRERNEIGVIVGERRDGVLVRIADDPGDAGKRGEFFGSALRIASGGDNAGTRVLTMDAADGFAGFRVGGGCDRACVEDDDVSGDVRFGDCAALSAEALANCVGVRLRGAAPEVLDEERGHELIATIILREAHGMPMLKRDS